MHPKAAVSSSESGNGLDGEDYLKYLLLNPNPSLEDDLPPLNLQSAMKSNENTPLPRTGNPDPYENPVDWHLINGQHGDGNTGDGSSHAGPSGTTNGGAGDRYYPQQEDWNCFMPRPLTNWPVPPLPFNCSCCHVLREIIHTHGAFDYSSNRIETSLDD